MRHILLIFTCLAAAVSLAAPAPKRILFIGNSYTAQVRKTLLEVLDGSAAKGCHCEFFTQGGATLKGHLGKEELHEKIRNGNWDVVVLQEQSQTPALPGGAAGSFQDSADQLCKLIKASGAKPAFYMTWGRRDGDAKNKEVFPDYKTMQDKLTAAYRTVAERNGAVLLPVGEVWAAVRGEDPVLGRELYKKDGSHPSAKGAYVVSVTFMKAIFGAEPKQLKSPAGVSSAEAQLIQRAVSALD